MSELRYPIKRAVVEVHPTAQEQFLAWTDKQDLGKLPPGVAAVIGLLSVPALWTDETT